MYSDSLLLVEDNPDDVFLMQRALKKSALEIPMFTVANGKAALDYLRGTGEFADREKYPLPSIIFLDLKLPYVSGFEVLQWIREHPVFESSNVIILTSSAEDRDARRAQELGVLAYLVKPPQPETLLRIIGPLLRPARVEITS